MIERVAQAHLGQSLLIEYRTGGSGTVAMQYIKDADPNGYALASCDNGGAIIAPIAQGLDFDADDVTPIAQISFQPWLMTARVGSPYNSVEDVVNAAKAGGDPLSIEISDMATSDHYGWLLFIKAAGLDPANFKWNPHGGGGEKMRAIMAGEGDLLNDDAGEIEQHVKAGTLKALAVYSDKRLPNFPDVPTLKELGYDVISGSAIALFAPPGLPEEKATKLREAMKAMKADPVLLESFELALQDPDTFVVDGFAESWKEDWGTARELLAAILQ
jgi:tripartite-type tricarboxylate transporter receptor subunit TctC